MIHRHGNVERGQAWDEIAATLNSLEEPFFKFTPRSVCDRYNLLVKKCKSKWRAEDKASGTAPNHIEIDEALLDSIERFDESDTARQKEIAEKIPKLKKSLHRYKTCKMSHFKHLARQGKGKKMVQIKVRKKDLVG